MAAHGGIIKSEYTILYGAVAFIFLVSGLQLSHEKLLTNLANWRLHIIVQGVSFILIPVIQLGSFDCLICFANPFLLHALFLHALFLHALLLPTPHLGPPSTINNPQLSSESSSQPATSIRVP